MSTIFKIRGLKFSNAALPSVLPFVRDGLVGAWRFGGSEASANDLSGNGALLTQVGNLEYLRTGVIGNSAEGFITNLRETKSFTMMTVHRNPSLSPGSAGNFTVGNYRAQGAVGGSSIYHNFNTTLATRGLSGQSHALSKTTGGQVNNQRYSPATAFDSREYVFQALRVDADSNTISLHLPKTGYVNSNTPNKDTESSFADRAINPNPFMIMMTTYAGWSATATALRPLEISEVLIYDKALTDAQIAEQYALSKLYHSKIKGITI